MAEAQLLLPSYLIPIRPARSVMVDQAVRLVDGRIDAICQRSEALEQFPDDPRCELPHHVLMPGLINMHTHSPMALLRGYADDLALQDWLEKHIWPAEKRWLSPQFVRDGAQLAMLEMLRGGTTCFNEMYFFPEKLAEVTAKVGMRASLAVPIIDVATPWASGLEDCLARGRELIAALSASELLTPALAPHATYTVDNAGLRAVAEIAGEHGLRVNVHLLEADWETARSLTQYGHEPLQRLAELDLLNERLIAIHMVHLSKDDIERVAQAEVQVVHCPESNLKLASGLSPVADLLSAGVNVSVGTDGAASNNNLDILSELRTAALLAKGVAGDPQALDAWQAMEMVTINAATALGLHEKIGTIEPGKQADLCALDLDAPETQPLHHVHSQLVYSASSRQFTDVWVAGRRLMQDGVVTTIDQQQVLGKAREWQRKMAEGQI